MSKNVLIFVLTIVVLVFGYRLAQLENYHYASVVSVCPELKADDPVQSMQRHECLHNTQTRTNPVWHIFYAVVGE